jgi:hypothetical protein
MNNATKAAKTQQLIKQLEEEINDRIDEWHNGAGDQSLREHLGMTQEEYVEFVCHPEAYLRKKINNVQKP